MPYSVEILFLVLSAELLPFRNGRLNTEILIGAIGKPVSVHIFSKILKEFIAHVEQNSWFPVAAHQKLTATSNAMLRTFIHEFAQGKLQDKDDNFFLIDQQFADTLLILYVNQVCKGHREKVPMNVFLKMPCAE